jgi:hypothetical protein
MEKRNGFLEHTANGVTGRERERERQREENTKELL